MLLADRTLGQRRKGNVGNRFNRNARLSTPTAVRRMVFRPQVLSNHHARPQRVSNSGCPGEIGTHQTRAIEAPGTNDMHRSAGIVTERSATDPLPQKFAGFKTD